MAADAATSSAKQAPEKDPGTSEELLARIVGFLEEEKAEELVQIDLRGRSQIADYMVVCSGRSTRQVTALAEKLSDTIKQDFGRFSKMEGKAQGDWVLLDTGDVVVHIFRPEVREFYQLEKMWLPGGTAELD
ncbi:ribosome silencing factor [Litoreibacter albidus]|uniref:Ribosomal silencing factor RsfS n=1 Tax=Litoreibacter albidus TaxID=670155 RepID=A0A1H2W4W2_9RHOB|nr:ribosome silencing factor [Litoreibacter albidus]SDW75496.1 ribosome-associated protein [Litoreibacter albidus]